MGSLVVPGSPAGAGCVTLALRIARSVSACLPKAALTGARFNRA